ncbi:hypothetical protein T09_9204 [Trichinella sp. T9]|nr:hypothetical protein T09_9204 [Trichinella sp. T9]
MNNQEIRIKTLAFLPVNLVPAGFEIINVGTSNQLEALFRYFQREWLPTIKFRFGMFMVCLCGLTTIWKFLQLIIDEQGKTETMVQQIDDDYTREMGFVRRSAAYGVQQSSQIEYLKISLETFRIATYCFPELSELLSVLFIIFTMADFPVLCLVPNCNGSMALDKKGCKGAVWTDLEVTAVINRKDHLSELLSVLFSIFTMADIPVLCLVPNRGGSMALVFEGRLYKLKQKGKQKKCWRCSKDKKGCKGAVWTDLEVTAVINRKDHVETCQVDEHLAYKMEKKALLKKRSADEMKPIPAIYDEEASAASAEPSTSGHFQVFKRVRAAMYKHQAKRFLRLPEHRHDLVIPDQFKTTKSGEDFLLCQSNSRHILVFATGTNIRLLAACRTWGMDGPFKIVPKWYQQLFCPPHFEHRLSPLLSGRQY